MHIAHCIPTGDPDNEDEGAMNENSIMVIQPYWRAGTRVFDDYAAGFVKEPFVCGIPEMITDIIRDFPDARLGFRLLFSAQPFLGHTDGSTGAGKRPEATGTTRPNLILKVGFVGLYSSISIKFLDRCMRMRRRCDWT